MSWHQANLESRKWRHGGGDERKPACRSTSKANWRRRKAKTWRYRGRKRRSCVAYGGGAQAGGRGGRICWRGEISISINNQAKLAGNIEEEETEESEMTAKYSIRRKPKKEVAMASTLQPAIRKKKM